MCVCAKLHRVQAWMRSGQQQSHGQTQSSISKKWLSQEGTLAAITTTTAIVTNTITTTTIATATRTTSTSFTTVTFFYFYHILFDFPFNCTKQPFFTNTPILQHYYSYHCHYCYYHYVLY